MRDRLIDLLWCVGREYDEYCDDSHEVGLSPMESFEEMAADHLLAAGVIVPPCKVGQLIWHITRHYDGRIDLMEGKVSMLQQKADKSWKIRISVRSSVWDFTPSEIGQIYFLTREEAEKALAERREG